MIENQIADAHLDTPSLIQMILWKVANRTFFHSYDEASPKTDLFDFVSMQNTNWPQSRFDYAKYGGCAA